MSDQSWHLNGFQQALEEWVGYDPPSGDLLAQVASFGGELERDPVAYAVEREHGNLYYCEVPGTGHAGRIVSITFTLSAPRPRGPGVIDCESVSCVTHPPDALFEIHPAPPHHRTPEKR